MRNPRLAAVAVVLLTGLLPAPAAAQCPPGEKIIGALAAVSGDVRVLRSHVPIPTTDGTVLCQGDVLKTGPSAGARVQFADRLSPDDEPTLMDVGGDTDVAVEEWGIQLEAEREQRQGLISLIRGFVRIMLRNDREGQFRIPIGPIKPTFCLHGIRGIRVDLQDGNPTELIFGHIPSSPPVAGAAANGGDSLVVAVKQGDCVCQPVGDPPQVRAVSSGQVLDVTPDGQVQVSPLDPARLALLEAMTRVPGTPPITDPVPDGRPATPVLTAQTNGLDLTLTWTAVLDALQYWLEVGTGPGLADLFNGFLTGTQLVTPGPAGRFWARIHAWNTQGYSTSSNEVDFTLTPGGGPGPGPGPCVAPPTPTNFARQLANGLLTLSWTGAAGATSYQLQAGTTRGSSNAFDGDIGPGPSATFNVAGVPQLLYFLRLLAKNLCGTSPPTPDIEVDLAPAPVPAPPPPPPPPPQHRWTQVGVGDCTGRDIVQTIGSPVPDPGRCTAQTRGLVAVCWDGITFSNRFAPPGQRWCTYKSVGTAACTGGTNPGFLYECVAGNP
jgi:hypothetical protein